MRMKRLLIVLLLGIISMSLIGCGNKTTKTSLNTETKTKPKQSEYYKEEKRVSSIDNVGGSNNLTLKMKDNVITLENAKVRALIKNDGTIIEYVNKESKLYLVKDSKNTTPIQIDTLKDDFLYYDQFSLDFVSNTQDLKKISITYTFGTISVETFISLAKDSDEIIFNLNLRNNDGTVRDIKYPIIDGIGSLDGKEYDYYVTSYATGILVNNPVDHFNDECFGIGKSLGMYPSGWYSTMQFNAYYSKGIGGFMWQTKDSKDTIKSFSFTGSNDLLELGIYHFLNDIAQENVDFDYDIVFSNLNKGTWEESAEKYRDWAEQQSWCELGKLDQREDINKDIFENTSLCIFGYRSTESSWKDMLSIYDMITSRIDNKIFNISIYHNRAYVQAVKEYKDLYAVFEFNTLSNAASQAANCMQDYKGNLKTFPLGSVPYYYQCAADDAWRAQRVKVDEGYIASYDVDALYFDVAYTAVHPIQCFNTKHTHGTFVNVNQYFNQQFKEASDLMDANGTYAVGAEMITEQALKYVDYYQARAAGDLAAYMETDSIRAMLSNHFAKLIPLFTYVYHEYGALRLDGFMVPDDELLTNSYHTAAWIALNGGIPEYNYEYYPASQLPTSSDISLVLTDYINDLGNVRSGYGKNYLVYGRMLRAPEIGSTQTEYTFNNPNYTPGTCNGQTTLGGIETYDDVLASAYSYNGKMAFFLSNITNKDREVAFEINMLEEYGLSDGTIYLVDQTGERKLTEINNGIAKISVSLKPYSIIMLEIK